MGDLNKIPGDSSEQEVVFLSDSSMESSEEIINLPGRNASTDITGNVRDISGAKQNDSKEFNGGTSVDVLNQANQLIDWINHYDSQRAEPCTSLRNRFAGGFRFIESLQSKFEETHRAILAKDLEITEVNGEKDILHQENEELRRQLERKNGELEKLKRRNSRLEEERRQRKADVMPLGKMRSKVDNLQLVFERLVGKMEEEPANIMDPMSLQKKQDLEVFQRDVGALFNEVQYKLRKWEKNQRDMEGEIESTKLALDRLKEMILLAEIKRSRKRGQEAERGTRDTSSVEVIMPPPPPPAPPTIKHTTNHQKKKKMLPPPLLPLTTKVAPTPPPIPVFARAAVPLPSHLIQQPIDLEMLASALSTLQHIPQSSIPMETMTPPPNILQRMHLNVMPPPLPKYSYPPPPPQKPLFSNGPVRAALSQHIQSQNALKSRQASLSKVPPPPPPQQYSQQYSNQPQEPQPSTSRGATGRSAVAGGSKYRKIAPYPATRPKGAKQKSSSFTTTSDGGETAANGNPVNQTDEVPPNAGSTENGENPAAPAPTGGLNICGLCGAAYNTLVQLKLHHTVIHAKSSTPTGAVNEAPQEPCPHSQNSSQAQQQQQPEVHHQQSQATSVVQRAPSCVPSTSTQIASTSAAAIASANLEYEQYLRQRITELANGYPMPSGSRSWTAHPQQFQTAPPSHPPHYVKPPTPPTLNEIDNNDNDSSSRNFTNIDENM